MASPVRSKHKRRSLSGTSIPSMPAASDGTVLVRDPKPAFLEAPRITVELVPVFVDEKDDRWDIDVWPRIRQ